MKFVAFSDSHASLRHHEKILECACVENASFIVCAGDLTNFGYWEYEGLQLFSQLKLPFLFVPGNHEYKDNHYAESKAFPFVINLDGRMKSLEGITLFGRGAADWTMSDLLFQDLDGDSRVFENLSKKLQKAPRPFVFITHCPPSQTSTSVERTSDGGSNMIRGAITRLKPNLVLCGHIHKPIQRYDKIGLSLVLNVAGTYAVCTFENGKLSCSMPEHQIDMSCEEMGR